MEKVRRLQPIGAVGTKCIDHIKRCPLSSRVTNSESDSTVEGEKIASRGLPLPA
jgi:hypothetical protein